MKTLDLEEASKFLKMHPQTVRRMAVAGELPAAKPGKCWAFIEDDLANWLRSRYVQPRQVPEGKEETPWRSIRGKGPLSGGPGSSSKNEKYVSLLGLKTGGRPESTK
jgi:excisionase family DNA binding protein